MGEQVLRPLQRTRPNPRVATVFRHSVWRQRAFAPRDFPAVRGFGVFLEALIIFTESSRMFALEIHRGVFVLCLVDTSLGVCHVEMKIVISVAFC